MARSSSTETAVLFFHRGAAASSAAWAAGFSSPRLRLSPAPMDGAGFLVASLVSRNTRSSCCW